MAIVKEKEPLVLSEHKNPEIENLEEIAIKPLEPFMAVVYKNGKGNRVEEGVTVSSFDESGIVQKIRGEIKALDRRLAQIPSLIQEVPKKKRKHGGRPVPKSERTQQRERLAKEMLSIPNRIIHREGMIKKLKTILISSDPLEPVQLEVARAKIKIREGKVLSEEDQEFWRYVRQEAPEILRHIESGQRGLFWIIHGVFIRRLDRHWAIKERKQEADDEFYRFIIEEVGEEKYKLISEDLRKITQYFTEILKS